MSLNTLSKVLVTLSLAAIAFSACSGSNAEATPTEPGLDAVYTAAAQTVEAQLTSTAAVRPSATLTPSVTFTGTATQTLAATQAATQTPPASGGGGSGAVGCNDSAYISDVTIPDNQQIAPGTAFTKTWRVQNTGTCAWNANYKLIFVSGEAMGGVATAINQTVNPGASADISVNLTAPATPKTYIGYWKLTTDSNQAFGTSLYVQIIVTGTPITPGTGTVLPSPTATFGAVGCYDSVLVSTTPADGATVQAGEAFDKTWVIKNTGTCDWNENFKFAFIGGDLLGSDTTKLRKGTIRPGNSVTFTMTFTAPNAPGTYTGYWRLMTDEGTLFGASFTVKIVVPGATHTPTFTPSITPTATITPTPTATTPAYP